MFSRTWLTQYVLHIIIIIIMTMTTVAKKHYHHCAQYDVRNNNIFNKHTFVIKIKTAIIHSYNTVEWCRGQTRKTGIIRHYVSIS